MPCTARISNQQILKEISPEYSLESLMLKLKPQYFGHLMWQANSFEQILMLGKIEGQRGKGQQKIKCVDSITFSMDMNLSRLWDILKERESWHAAVHGVAKYWSWLHMLLKNNNKDLFKGGSICNFINDFSNFSLLSLLVSLKFYQFCLYWLFLKFMSRKYKDSVE